MKNLNLFKLCINTLSFPVIIFLSVLFITSCNKDSEVKNSTMNDNSMKSKSMDSMQNKSMNNNMTDNNMSNMINKMNKMKMSGNTDVDFINMMIIHHQGAIDMATLETSSGKDEKIKSMAANIIKDQQKEILTMQNWAEKNKDKKIKPDDNSMKLMESMSVMTKPGIKMTGDADMDFVTMMILHHKGAIEMSKVEINGGADPEIKKMAQDIIKKQEAEIKQMEDWQNSKNK